MANTSTALIWQGPSRLTGAPVGVFLTGLTQRSKNAKIGDMLQTWVLRLDCDPVWAVKWGGDEAVCGDCKHRGQGGQQRTCYVQVKNAPLAVFRSWAAGNVPVRTLTELAPLIAGRAVRFGAYGDPAAAPSELWAELAKLSKRHTGYTHQWKAGTLQGLCMASVDTVTEQAQAQALGFRTFRVKRPAEGLSVGEITCPASAEAGHRTTCARCGLCDGARAADSRRSIAIEVHGPGAGAFRMIALRAV